MRSLKRSMAWFMPAWLIVLGCSLGPQWSTVTFDRSWKGNWPTRGQSVEQTSDHGYVIGALWATDSAGKSAALIRTDSLGETLWTRRFPLDEGGYACVTKDSGFVVVGSASYQSDHNAGQRGMVIKVGSNGQVRWQHELADNHRMWCEAVAATEDGGCIVGGTLDGIYQTWLLKLTADGNRVWFRVFPEDFLLGGATSIEQTKDHGFFISGWGWDSTRGTCHGMVRTDSSGREVWSRTFIESEGFGYGGAATEGGYVAVGDGSGPVDRHEANRLAVAGQPPSGFYDMLNGPYWRVTEELQSYAKRGRARIPRCDAAYLVKINPDGQLDWWHYYRPRNHQTRAVAMACARDGGFVFCGEITDLTRPKQGRPYLVKTDAAGHVQWERILSDRREPSTFAAAVKQTHDGGYVLVGSAQGKGVTFIKTDQYGRVIRIPPR